jgi:hypothetical protein
MGKPAVVGTLHLRLDEKGLILSATQPPELAAGEEAEPAAGEGKEAEGIMAEEGLVEGGIEVRSGSLITVDGTNGVIYLGEMPTVRLGQDADFQSIMVWGDRYLHPLYHSHTLPLCCYAVMLLYAYKLLLSAFICSCPYTPYPLYPQYPLYPLFNLHAVG